MTSHPPGLLDHLRLTVLTELAVLVHEAFPEDDASDHHYGCEALLALVQERRRQLADGAPPLEPVESARLEP